jgi:hypothetical protein
MSGTADTRTGTQPLPPWGLLIAFLLLVAAAGSLLKVENIVNAMPESLRVLLMIAVFTGIGAALAALIPACIRRGMYWLQHERRPRSGSNPGGSSS